MLNRLKEAVQVRLMGKKESQRLSKKPLKRLAKRLVRTIIPSIRMGLIRRRLHRRVPSAAIVIALAVESPLPFAKSLDLTRRRSLRICAK